MAIHIHLSFQPAVADIDVITPFGLTGESLFSVQFRAIMTSILVEDALGVLHQRDGGRFTARVHSVRGRARPEDDWLSFNLRSSVALSSNMLLLGFLRSAYLCHILMRS